MSSANLKPKGFLTKGFSHCRLEQPLSRFAQSLTQPHLGATEVETSLQSGVGQNIFNLNTTTTSQRDNKWQMSLA